MLEDSDLHKGGTYTAKFTFFDDGESKIPSGCVLYHAEPSSNRSNKWNFYDQQRKSIICVLSREHAMNNLRIFVDSTESSGIEEEINDGDE